MSLTKTIKVEILLSTTPRYTVCPIIVSAIENKEQRS